MASTDEKFMRRALQLARCGEGRTAPNPMVGAVVVAEGRIIGEGYHRTFGGPHAEVNAIASISPEDNRLLPESTIYVTLEPCSHYGKTPPCAALIIRKGLRRVVAGAPDPNPLVAGRGFRMLREAGIEVTDGVLLHDCISINRRFMTAHTLGRPWVQLKWAQSADGFMAALDGQGKPRPVKFSDSLTSVWMHRQRAASMAIMVGRNTMETDRPRLDVRFWGGPDPEIIPCGHDVDLAALLADLHRRGIQSLLVEGGPSLLRSFIEAGIYDEIRVETAPAALGVGLPAPAVPLPGISPSPAHGELKLVASEVCRGNLITTFRR